MVGSPRPGKEHCLAELGQRLSPATSVRWDEPLTKRTTLRVGGPADLYVVPASAEDLAVVLSYCAGKALPWVVLGHGSNLLVRDGGFRGVVISLAHPNFSRIERIGVRLRCGAGAGLKSVAIEARRQGLAGFEFLEGIPGSIGGALRMNAGAMGGAIFDLVESVQLMDSQGACRELAARDLAFEYRGCPALKAQIALAAVLTGTPEAPDAIAWRMNAFSQKRRSSQPAAPSAGCIFKNPPAVAAGRLIDELGLKGARVGGAVVSAEHGNFIVNEGTATARDVLELIALIQGRARAERGIELQTEVEIIGDEPLL
jgi:UDP-N-acetylenolpyruvoylglucosamine reductase